MGIFSFGKKDDDAPSRRGARSGASRNVRTERVERRSRRTERADGDALLLDPTLPEKQRARRRLVGAIALMVAAVIVLPMVLDSHPKPVTSDIAIDIPNPPAKAAPAGNAPDTADTQAGVVPDEPAASAATAAAVASQPQPAAPAADSRHAARSASKDSTAAARPAQTKTADAREASPPSSASGAHFVVQLGSFPDAAAANAWVAKLKKAGVPAYAEHRKQADGTTATLLRAGPFTDRAAASDAIAKVREAGLAH